MVGLSCWFAGMNLGIVGNILVTYWSIVRAEEFLALTFESCILLTFAPSGGSNGENQREVCMALSPVLGLVFRGLAP